MNRIAWIDWAKVICITLMVSAHMWMPKSLAILIYTFHMPCLFIISGILHKSHKISNIFFSNFVPVVIFSLITLIYKIINHNAENIIYLDYNQNFGSGLFTGVWFIEALFLIKIIYELCDKRILKWIFYFCLVLLTIYPYIKSSIWDYYPMRFFSCFPFYYVGTKLKGIELKKTYIVFGFIALILLYIDGQHSLRCNGFGFSYLSFLAGATLVSLGLFTTCSYLKNNDFISTLSSGTILILGIHGILINVLTPLLMGKLWPVSYIIIPIEIIFICYIMIKLCLKYCPWSIGKVPKYFK